MFRFFLGFAAGIYTGTYYNCKPIMDRLQECIKENIPEHLNNIEEKNRKKKKKDKK